MNRCKRLPSLFDGIARHAVVGALAGLLVLQAGCATIVSGTSQQIAVDSTPQGAEVLIDGTMVGRTPVAPEVRRKAEHDVTLRKEGYLDRTVHTGKRLNLWYMGNLLFGSLLGMLIDDASGASFVVEPDKIHARLVEAPIDVVSTQQPPSEPVDTPAWSMPRQADEEDR